MRCVGKRVTPGRVLSLIQVNWKFRIRHTQELLRVNHVCLTSTGHMKHPMENTQGKVASVTVPSGSLLAQFTPPELDPNAAYRDCFSRIVPGAITMESYIERFYSSAAFRPERWALSLIGKGASNEDAKALARGEADSFAAWNVVEHQRAEVSDLETEHKIKTQAKLYSHPQLLMRDFQGRTASWLSVRPCVDQETGKVATELLFGSWVGVPEGLLFKMLTPIHRWYSRVLLAGVF